VYRRFLVFSFLVWLILAGRIASVHARQLAGAVEVVDSSLQNLSLRIRLPSTPASDMLLSGDSSYKTPIVVGGGQLEVGKPDLPAFGEWVLVPNGTVLAMSVDPGLPVVFENVDVAPVQPPVPDGSAAVVPQFAMDVVTYASDADYPGIFAKAEPPGNVRG